MSQTKTTKAGDCPNCGFDQDGGCPTHCFRCHWPMPWPFHIANAKTPSAPTQKSAKGQKESTPLPFLHIAAEVRAEIRTHPNGGELIADVFGGINAAAYAKEIVTRCNSHQELLEACKEAMRWFDNEGDYLLKDAKCETRHDATNMVLAAIRKVEGRQ